MVKFAANLTFLFSMWKFLYQLSSPKTFYQLSGRFLPWLSCLSVLLLCTALVWGLFWAPADYQQGDAFRIIYVHVPAAFLSMSLYAFMAFLAFLLLVWRIKIAGLVMRRTAELGGTMAFLALLTGSIWGKPMWGAWWVWDARLTSELILLFLYIAMMLTANASRNPEQGERLMAILVLVGLIDLPIIHYSVYWWNTLHQGATLSLMSTPKIAAPMLYPLLLSLMGFAFYCAWLILARVRHDLLLRERQQRWVSLVLEGVS